MTRFFLIMIVCCWASVCDAQRRNENWVMSDHNWVQFLPGFGSLSLYAPSALFHGQSPISISDTAGGLLFYGNSSNGSGLYGNDHAPYPGYPPHNNVPQSFYAQGSFVIPRPGDPELYYVFYSGEVPVNNFEPASGYLEVDMTLRGGLGDVVSGSFQHLSDSTTSHLHGVAHSNGMDYWLLMHRFRSDVFLAYHVSAGGVAPQPVLSAAGPQLVDTLPFLGATPATHMFGHLVANSSGTKLALTSGWGGRSGAAFTHLFNFNQSTGQVAHISAIPVDPNVNISGIEFSPNGDLLYVMDIYHEDPNNITLYGDNARIWQFDVSTTDSTTIANSKFLVHQKDSIQSYQLVLSGLALAPDGSIYTHYDGALNSDADEWLGSIVSPDLLGAACDFQQKSIELFSKDILALPNQLKRYNTDFSVQVEIMLDPSATPTIELYPNPSSGLVNVTVSGINTQEVVVRDVLGREQLRTTLRSSAERFTLNVATLASGAYTLTVTDGKTTRLSTSLIKE